MYTDVVNVKSFSFNSMKSVIITNKKTRRRTKVGIQNRHWQ